MPSNLLTSPIPMTTQPIRSQNYSTPVSSNSYGPPNPILTDGSPNSSMTYKSPSSLSISYGIPNSSIHYRTPRPTTPAMTFGTPISSMTYGAPNCILNKGSPTSSSNYGTSTQMSPLNYGSSSCPMNFESPTSSGASGFSVFSSNYATTDVNITSSIMNEKFASQINQEDNHDKSIKESLDKAKTKDYNQSKKIAPKFKFKKKTESLTYSNSIMDRTQSNAFSISRTENQFCNIDADSFESYPIPPTSHNYEMERLYCANSPRISNAYLSNTKTDNVLDIEKTKSRKLEAMPILGKNFRTESSSSLDDEYVCTVSNAGPASKNDHTFRLSDDEEKHDESDMFKKPLAPMNSSFASLGKLSNPGPSNSNYHNLQVRENFPFGFKTRYLLHYFKKIDLET